MAVVTYKQNITDSLAQSIESLIKSQSVETDERPNKRRKLIQDVTDDSFQVADTTAHDDYVVLCRITIDLACPGGGFSESLPTTDGLPVLLKYRNEKRILSSSDLELSDSQRTSGNDTNEHWLDVRTINRKQISSVRLIEVDVENVVSHLSLATRATSIDIPNGDRSLFCYRARVSCQDSHSFRLRVDVLWKDTLFIPANARVKGPPGLAFVKYTPPGEGLYRQTEQSYKGRVQHPRWTPRDFYDNVHVPADTPEASSEIICPQVKCKLYPFQNRAVRWLLEKEGMELDMYGNVVPMKTKTAGLPESFQEFTDVEGRRYFSSQLYRVVATDMSPWYDSDRNLRGGILAEEMGLGKTVELISLISLHRRDMTASDSDGHHPVIKSRATLIITPPAIHEQWKQELQVHAPSLTVFDYQGFQANSKLSEEQLLSSLTETDVVLTTYNVLSKEVHRATDPPKRNMRHEKRFEVPKSPLVRISWWRVCLDEAQMIESGVSNAAQVARLIPRVNAWAVTGTPIRKDMRDLFGLLQFLRYEPFCGSLDLWSRLYSDYYSAFKSIVSRLALRHSKEFIRDDLKLPPQKRVVITIPFTAVEEQHYSELFEKMCEDCGVDLSGAPLEKEWNPESQASIEKMRSWLTRLRQTCLHPEVARRNRRALGRTNGPLRSVNEVLEVMIDQNETSIRAEERSLLLSQARRGQLLENAIRRREALEIWQKGLERATQMVDDCREELQAEIAKTKSSVISASDPGSDSESEKDEADQSGKNTRIGACKSRLRSALEVQHVCKFFTANAFYQIKTDKTMTEPDSEEFKALQKAEEEAYDEAKLIRKEMLKDVARKATKRIKVLDDKAKGNSFVKIPVMKVKLPTLGIEARRIFERLENLCDALNKNRELFNEWRDTMVKLLRQSLVDEERTTELEGNEYETSTKHQDEMYVYMEGLRVLFADRHEALTGQSNFLIKNEVRFAVNEAREGNGASPKLYLKLMGTRDGIKPKPDLGSLRGLISDMRSLATSLEWQAMEGSSRARAESVIVNEALERMSKTSVEQAKSIAVLDQEVELFRDTMNIRLEYYKQLQQISDTVAPYDEGSVGKPVDQAVYDSKLEIEHKMQQKLDSLQSKRRYLIHLRDESEPDESTRMCIICQSTFEIGVLTVCGHKFCKGCLRIWWHQHRTCPTCKRKLKANDFHQITYKPKELLVQEERTPTKVEYGRPSQNGIYSDVSTGILQEIKDIDLPTSFGTKIDTLSRHLMWLREHDPGAKSIVFSQYRDFLGVLANAFSRFKIGFSSVEAKNGIQKFKEDAAAECFLLHARAHSSGLNLVNATHVFLCEPLINTAIELQAIARVHRIGQHRPTTVWMYLVSDTVEESIYQISVSRRLSHIVQKEKEKQKDLNSPSPGLKNGTTIENLTETAIESANSLEIQDATLSKMFASGSAGGELVGKDDLWQCLFGDGQRKTLPSKNDDAVREVDRFLRGEAAEKRRQDTMDF
ncbi:SNF2 family helicase/ATPase, putative [Talaromyces stipitatus ATCC 10500]|uniref:SNF2 family helicase/ATPase, putative n=1 Tax=Talaromyces stipitatus (strain ATCC 10500 / CBS 375.48 / QM 6759 / NRRL 1006) TaxID=441959 RepID=B8M7F7_TALSN|nr:SNF2 family helicase/ATPase, putative [Talaromyces stipitatus ATCC 10500]EED20377.1 SNF2 family helicase/ATPase, putative [Talaromyces stipitatus ATCC 10500]